MNVIDFKEARARIVRTPQNPVVQALDALALALADTGHKWTDHEVRLYETAISYCGYKES